MAHRLFLILLQRAIPVCVIAPKRILLGAG